MGVYRAWACRTTAQVTEDPAFCRLGTKPPNNNSTVAPSSKETCNLKPSPYRFKRSYVKSPLGPKH